MAYPFERFIWTYHVALFMFLSGCVYKATGEWSKKGSRGKYLAYKAVSIGIPYLVFSVVYIIINSCVPGTNTGYSLRDILLLWWKPVAQYWYLYGLLILFCCFVLLSKWMDYIWVTIILMVMSYAKLMFINFSVPVIDDGLSWAFAFGLGIVAAGLVYREYNAWVVTALCMGHIAMEAALLKFNLSGKLIIADVEKVVGILASIAIVSNLMKAEKIKGCLLWLSRYSFQIFLLHTIFTAGVRIALKKAGIDSYAIHVIAGITIGMVMPVIISFLAEKTKYMSYIFFPMRIAGAEKIQERRNLK